MVERRRLRKLARYQPLHRAAAPCWMGMEIVDSLVEAPAATGRDLSVSTAVGVLGGGPRRSSGWLRQQCREFLLGEPPQALPEPDATQQVRVLVDPAGRDTQRLGDLLHGQIAAHRSPPGMAPNRRRAGRVRAAGG